MQLTSATMHLATIFVVSLSIISPITSICQNDCKQKIKQNQLNGHNDIDINSTINMQNTQENDDITSSELSSFSSHIFTTFKRINSMRTYNIDVHHYRDDLKYAGDPNFVNSSSAEDKLLCSRHLSIYNKLLLNYQNQDPTEKISLDALKLADTFGRPEASILEGNQFWLGDYRACKRFKHQTKIVSTSLHNDTYETIKGHYCVGVGQFADWDSEDGLHSIKIGLCLPETCTTSMIDEDIAMLNRVKTMMMYFVNQNGPHSRLNLSHVYCLPHETSQIRQLSFEGKSLVYLMTFIVSISLLGTLLDCMHLDDKQNANSKLYLLIDVIVSFSIIQNVKRLFQLQPSSQQSKPEEIESKISCEIDENNAISTDEACWNGSFDKDMFFNCMAGIKSIGFVWVTAAHTFLIWPILSSGINDIDGLTKTWLADLYLGAHLLVDTFFVCMGMIASYSVFKFGINKITSKQWIFITVHRYWRLTPVYLLCFWFTKSMGSYVNDGPMWDYATTESSPRSLCAKESWFVALLHLSDFKTAKEHCVPFAWFIANGIKFWIITPLFLIQIGKSMKRGYSIIIGAILANIILVYWLASQCQIDIEAVMSFKPESTDNMINNMGQIYNRPYSRISPYLIGLLIGHIFYREDIGQLKIKLTRRLNQFAWIISLTISISLVFLLKIFEHVEMDTTYMRDGFNFASALGRPVWALCTAWFVFALAHGQARWLGNFLSSSFWRIFVRISFCAHLIEAEVIAQMFLSAPVISRSIEYMDLYSKPLFVTLVTCFVSFFMVILVEYPLNRLEKFIFPTYKKGKQTYEPSQVQQKDAQKLNEFNENPIESKQAEICDKKND